MVPPADFSSGRYALLHSPFIDPSHFRSVLPTGNFTTVIPSSCTWRNVSGVGAVWSLLPGLQIGTSLKKRWGLTLLDVDVLLDFPPCIGFFGKGKDTAIQKKHTHCSEVHAGLALLPSCGLCSSSEFLS
ncbi:unnamed protein product [Sphenostylis stenocarpa]|uniref:Uncharacterized protein n=1 Tax=Sphenostylis stenocarpa TaxID=92480 RepID=A0AA86SQR0_9FABA|nr:unnamed protein product [Sphenostylis stenocarpa]